MRNSEDDHTDTERRTGSTADRAWIRVLVPGLLVAGLLGVFVVGVLAASGTASAVLAFPIPNATAILPDATATPSGHNVVVDGTTACTEGEIVEVRIVVTQASTDARAAGTMRARCVGVDDIQGWTIHAATRGPVAFEDAHVEAWATTRARGRVTDTLRWQRDVTIDRRGSTPVASDRLRN